MDLWESRNCRVAEFFTRLMLEGFRRNDDQGIYRICIDLSGDQVVNWLVVEPTHLKNVSQNGNLPHNRGEN